MDERTRKGRDEPDAETAKHDRTLVKFYAKHVDEHVNELGALFERLTTTPTDVQQQRKLALTVHKVLFVCDSLERNVRGVTLRADLARASVHIDHALKNYVKTTAPSCGYATVGNTRPLPLPSASNASTALEHQQQHREALVNVIDSARRVKQIVSTCYPK